jgi:hypothetical protein
LISIFFVCLFKLTDGKLVPNVAKFGPVISIRSLIKNQKNVFVGKKPACVNGTDPFLFTNASIIIVF